MAASLCAGAVAGRAALPRADVARPFGTRAPSAVSFPRRRGARGPICSADNETVGDTRPPPQPVPGDNESKAVLDAFFLGKALAEVVNERIESTVGEIFSVFGQWQAERQKEVQEFQDEVFERAKKAKKNAATMASTTADEIKPKPLEEKPWSASDVE